MPHIDMSEQDLNSVFIPLSKSGQCHDQDLPLPSDVNGFHPVIKVRAMPPFIGATPDKQHEFSSRYQSPGNATNWESDQKFSAGFSSRYQSPGNATNSLDYSANSTGRFHPVIKVRAMPL